MKHSTRRKLAQLNVTEYSLMSISITKTNHNYNMY